MEKSFITSGPVRKYCVFKQHKVNSEMFAMILFSQ